MKKLFSVFFVFAALLMVFSVNSCKGGKSGKVVGISMPTKSSERWISDGNSMVQQFEALGYQCDLQYGEDIIENQVAQLENMITKGVDALIIAAIDGKALGKIMEMAKDQDIPVIAYDRSILATPTCAYYATFDNFKVGVLQASDIETRLGLKDGKGPFNIELFGGSPDDTNAFFFFDGGMSVLKPYIDSGKLVVRSGQMDMDVCGTLRWDGAVAQARMDNLLTRYYTKEKVDAVLSPYDGLSRGIISSLKAVGYGTGSQKMPIVTGQDAEVASVKAIIAGEQTSTVYKDTRVLAKRAVTIVDSIFKGEKPEVNDTGTYKSGDGTPIPTYQEVPVLVDITNYKEQLLDSGYIKEADLK